MRMIIEKNITHEAKIFYSEQKILNLMITSRYSRFPKILVFKNLAWIQAIGISFLYHHHLSMPCNISSCCGHHGYLSIYWNPSSFWVCVMVGSEKIFAWGCKKNCVTGRFATQLRYSTQIPYRICTGISLCHNCMAASACPFGEWV